MAKRMASPVTKLTGTISDADGHPMRAASVLFLSQPDHIRSTTVTDEDGNFMAYFTTPGEHRVLVLARGADYQSFRDPLFLKVHQTTSRR